MYSTGATTAQKLAQSLRQFHKTFALFGKNEMHQNLSGCKPSEVGLLFILRHKTKPGQREMKVSEISKMMRVTTPTVTQSLKNLEANGLVERHFDPNDRRVVGIALTEQGADVAMKAEEGIINAVYGLVDYLGEEESNQFSELLLKASRYFREREASTYEFDFHDIQ